MPRHPGVSQWHQTVSTYLPQLSRPHLTVLVLWSIGGFIEMIVTGAIVGAIYKPAAAQTS